MAATDSEHSVGSHFDAVGGAEGIRQAVQIFYGAVLADDRLKAYFADVDMPRLKHHQAALLTQVLGGPAEFVGRDLRTAHHGLNISDDHYDVVVEHLRATLIGLGASDAVLATIAETLDAVREQVLDRPAAPEQG